MCNIIATVIKTQTLFLRKYFLKLKTKHFFQNNIDILKKYTIKVPLYPSG